jgi:hypothetical protein
VGGRGGGVPGGREVLCERGWPRTGIERLSSIEEAGEALVGVQELCRRGIQSGYWCIGGGCRWASVADAMYTGAPSR